MEANLTQLDFDISQAQNRLQCLNDIKTKIAAHPFISMTADCPNAYIKIVYPNKSNSFNTSYVGYRCCITHPNNPEDVLANFYGNISIDGNWITLIDFCPRFHNYMSNTFNASEFKEIFKKKYFVNDFELLAEILKNTAKLVAANKPELKKRSWGTTYGLSDEQRDAILTYFQICAKKALIIKEGTKGRKLK